MRAMLVPPREGEEERGKVHREQGRGEWKRVLATYE